MGMPLSIRRFPAATLAVVLLWSATTAHAQDPFGSTAESPESTTGEALQDYRVELIVFEYGDSLAGTTEDWSDPTAAAPAPSGEDASDETSDEAGDSRDSGLIEITDDPPDLNFRPLTEADFALTEVANRLARSRGYRMLLHVAWEQPGYGRESARPLALSRLAELPDRLGGDVRLYRSRFLHLAVDLELVSDEPASLVTPVVSAGDDPFAALGPVVYRLDESRKMKSGELHYFDHPRFGVVARVTPVAR
ncbi:MAG: CsiV family protein [Gammaproteobacteria bacterium]|jgi:hypothetical protein